MKIDFNKTYVTRHEKHKVTLLPNFRTGCSEKPIAAIIHFPDMDDIFKFTEEGCIYEGTKSRIDLIEYSQIFDLKVDDQVLVRNNVIPLNNYVNRRIKLDADKVAESTKDMSYDTIIVCGFDNDGGFLLQSNIARKADLIYILKNAEHKLMNGDYD